MDQVHVLSAICKKLNNDIESIANQISLRETALVKLDANQKVQDDQLRQMNIDLQSKFSRTDAISQKIRSDIEQLSNGLREAINNQQELNRSNAQRNQELKLEISALSQRIDRLFNEQQVILRTFESDTARALSTTDSRSRAFVDELRSQIFQLKSQDENDRERSDQKLNQKLDEIKRSVEKYERFEKRIEDAIQHFEQKSASLEDHYKRATSSLNRNNESIEQAVYKRFDDKYQRTVASLEKVKNEMRTCFESLEGSVKTLQRVTDGRIKVTEEKFDKEVEKLRSSLVLI
ncbi:unnamed protein product [Rotaria socialis]|uniref:Uncharacterized protein n=1 Tax=Rotaria socialis TaxID=392032 RepID=A0A818JII5_9BILA|nr:unnamed protein product [Rotaria socialis]CAF3552079.1 unnamed protein product [Rotaria socialis]CAF4295647.1 unnamed protein product [Rotaria socialis]CAF4733008.1 unnamed protein product [Rotaria socialis]